MIEVEKKMTRPWREIVVDRVVEPIVVFTPRIAFNSVETVKWNNARTIENIKTRLVRAVTVMTSKDASCPVPGSAVTRGATLCRRPADQTIR